MIQQLGTFLANSNSWLSVGAVIVGLSYVILYDIIWTWIMKDPWAKFWFERAQAWIKFSVYFALFGLIALLIFVPWPWNIIIVIALILATVFIVVWLKQTHKI